VEQQRKVMGFSPENYIIADYLIIHHKSLVGAIHELPQNYELIISDL